MGFLEKLKLLIRERQPVEDLINQVKEVKTGYKTWQFWMTLLPLIGAVAAGLAGVIPASTILIITAAIALITSIYNLWRGAVKSQVSNQKPFFQTTEFWASVAGCFTTAIVTLQGGGINPVWFKTVLGAFAVILGSLGAGQNLAGQTPSPSSQGK